MSFPFPTPSKAPSAPEISSQAPLNPEPLSQSPSDPEKFNILDHLEKLEKAKNGKYICPVCGKNDFSVQEKPGKLQGAYKCFSGDCPPSKIREALSPWADKQGKKGDRLQRIIQRKKSKPVLKKKPALQPIPENLTLVRLPAPATDRPQRISKFDARRGDTKELIYSYSETQWVVRTEWKDLSCPKGRAKKFSQCHRDKKGETAWNKGSQPWKPYRIDEALSVAAASDSNLALALTFAEGEECVEALRSIGLASITLQGSNWSKEELQRMVEVIKASPVKCLIFLKDNDDTGEKKAKAVYDACVNGGLNLLIVDPLAISPQLASKGDIAQLGNKADVADILQEMESAEFITQLEQYIHRAVQARWSEVPLEQCIKEEDRSLLDRNWDFGSNGVVGEDRPIVGARLAANLIGTAKRMNVLGIPMSGSAWLLFQNYCSVCSSEPPEGWKNEDWDRAWKEGESNPGATLSDEEIWNLAKTWQDDQKTKQSPTEAGEEGKGQTQATEKSASPEIDTNSQWDEDDEDDCPESLEEIETEITQIAFRHHYIDVDNPWICVDGTLYQWVGTHYEERPDTLELQKLSHYLNAYPVTTKKGDTRFPYARPSAAREVLSWVKMNLTKNPALVNPPGLNCTNGILKIHWDKDKPSWELVEHTPDAYYLYPPCAEYNPDANPEHCDRLLQVLDPPQLEILLRTIAASLDFTNVRRYRGREVRAVIAKGHGGNGKDAVREGVSAIYGHQGVGSISLSNFAAYDAGRQFGLAGLDKLRVVWSSENSNFEKLDKIQCLKAGITGETLLRELKGKDAIPFIPRAVFIFNVNDTPNLQGSQEAILSRYCVLTFNKTFKVNADPRKGELEADPRFKYDPEFIRTQVVPALLNRILKALVDLMEHGIDYECTRQALQEIQAENSHLSEFCQSVKLDYKVGGVVTAQEIWERLQQFYIANGTLTFEVGGNGKPKSIWADQPRRGDRNVKGCNQVLARFQELFPKAKRVPFGKNQMALSGIGFLGEGNDGEGLPNGSNNSPPPPPSGEADQGNGKAMSCQLACQKPAPSNDGEPVWSVSQLNEKNEISSPMSDLLPDLGSEKNVEKGQQFEKLTRLAHHVDTARVSGKPTDPPTGSPPSETGSLSQADLVDPEIIREWQCRLIAASVEEILPLMNSFALSFSDEYSSEEIKRIHHRVWWGLKEEERAVITSKRQAAENIVKKAKREEELRFLEEERKQRFFSESKFKPGEQVVFSEDKRIVYTVVSSTHNHTTLEGIDKAVADFLLERLE
ncbi:hypothetical protein NDI44_28070 [Trichocoleus sp. DQ-A3]|uniref:DUF5906 domain-containing protein n=1 Tax=Cyanophyceae TaxID=3028117 RepID=UPI0016840A98|nr:DUF5906 domain-containing protein [Coleofasciculus sp. FACHB-125]MBD1903744.1 hypothetical protein [Coleofasciculus sp. FACHB-125]